MHSSPLSAHLEGIWQAIEPLLPTFTVELLPSVDSTNSELMRRARAGAVEPVLLAADSQTAGRGRMGKAWHSQAGQSLTFSLSLPLSPASWSGLSLAVGVSLAESLHPEVRLKWPNDLWLHGRKLGGILVETAHHGEGARQPRVVVVGVGINIARPDAAAVAGASSTPPPVPAAGLAEICIGQTAGETLAALAPGLARDLLRFEAEGFAAFAQRFEALDALQGRMVTLSDGSHGRADGVDASGALRVQTDAGCRVINSAQVSVRPC